ncbi:MAG: FHA domain-containing protein [Gammaproteobacteria bacterium]|nr:FHA domain-containing protein [Gammaproteobacteria bacterium]
MARLILSLDNQVLAEYNMTKERYTVGRLPDNDVRIDNPAVSGHHSLIINILNDSFLEDLNSTNGTYVNGKLIKKHALQHGDVITIGHHQLRFSDQQTHDTEQDEFEKTMVIPAGQQNAEQLAKAEAAADKAAAAVDVAAAAVRLDPEEAADLTGEPAREPTPVPEPAAARAPRPSHAEPVAHSETQVGVDAVAPPNALPLAKLQVLSGSFAGRELELTKALTTLGRPGVQVAAITRRAEGYFIVHVESGKEDDYPLVNGQAIGPQARKLADNDVVQLAGVKMGFFAA